MMRKLVLTALVATLPLVASACTDASAGESTDGSADATTVASAERTAASSTDQELPTILVYKSPTCGCCNGWIEHLEAAGFTVDARDVRDIMSIKVDAGVPTPMSSCHTALVDGYVVEGHVPAEHVKRLIADDPEIAGIAVPGMPVGSPGMEGPNAQPYQILSFTRDGQAAVYADVDPR